MTLIGPKRLASWRPRYKTHVLILTNRAWLILDNICPNPKRSQVRANPS